MSQYSNWGKNENWHVLLDTYITNIIIIYNVIINIILDLDSYNSIRCSIDTDRVIHLTHGGLVPII